MTRGTHAGPAAGRPAEQRRPFRQFVLKVHSRCDLACDHCYVYRHADQSWAGRPRVVPDHVVRRTARRIAEHALDHRLRRVHVVLHGGEPLLAGRERLRRIAGELRAALEPEVELDLRMQTNGLLLDDAFCAMLVEQRIRTGVSIDGDRASHDRHRRRPDGSGSHADVVRAVRLLGSPSYRSAFAGLLCTVDVRNPPAAVYDGLAALDPPRVDLLLPHATWDRPPPRGGEPGADAGTEYARWLIAVHHRWAAAGRPFPVRLFDFIEGALLGAAATTEAMGLDSPDLAVVETDGAIEQADWLKVVAHGAPATGFHVDRHSFTEAAAHPGFLARAAGLDGLSETCRGCPVVRTCGGGLYGHRYRSGSGFDNPSVYCADLFRLVTHVQAAAPRGRPAGRGGRGAHRMSGAAFDELAAGRGGAGALAGLAEAQASLRRGLLGNVREHYGGAADPAWQALTALDVRHPEAVSRVLAHPYLGAWASGVLAADGRCGGGAAPPPDPGRPAEIALAAAVRCGAELSLRVPLRRGAVHLPLLGRLVVLDPPCEPSPAVELTARGGELLLGGASAVSVRAGPPGTRWEPVAFLTLGGRPVPLEDTDPYRDVFAAPPAPRGSRRQAAARAERWQRALDGAWEQVRSRHPGQAAGVAALPLALTPLADRSCPGRADAARPCFGAVGLARPADPAALARLLVDAVQSVKFGALLDVFPLLAPDGPGDPAVPRRPVADVTDRPSRSARRSGEALLRDAYVRTAHPHAPVAAGAADPAALSRLPLTPLGRRLLAGVLAATGPATGTATGRR